MPKAIVLVALCAALFGCATATVASDPDSKRAVEQASDRFFQTRQTGDAASFAALFTDDGVFMVPGLLDATGRNAVQELARKRFASGRTTDFVMQRREIDVLGDSAYELGWFAETSGEHRMQGRHLLVWKRGSDNVWRVHRYLYNFSDAKPLS